jgi:hypothetical protein
MESADGNAWKAAPHNEQNQGMAQKDGWMVQELGRIQFLNRRPHVAARTDDEKGGNSERRKRKIAQVVE